MAHWRDLGKTLVEQPFLPCHLRTLTFLAPSRWPDSLDKLSAKPCCIGAWSQRRLDIKNAHHGGRIDKSHAALILGPRRIIAELKLSGYTVAEPSSMNEAIDPAGSPRGQS